MTTSVPNSPKELLDIQSKLDEMTWEDMMMKEVTDHSPLETKELMVRMVQLLKRFHMGGVVHYGEQGDTESMMNWVVDVERLDQINHLLSLIELG